MSTRNLTVIYKDGEIKLSQYGQWDGYFDYAGEQFHQFVRKNVKGTKYGTKREYNYRLEQFKEKVDMLKPIPQAKLDKIYKMVEPLNAGMNGFTLPFDNVLPMFSCNTGVKILDIINNLKSYEFRDGDKFPVVLTGATGGIFRIEFAYAVDLDNEKVYYFTSHDFDGDEEAKVKGFDGMPVPIATMARGAGLTCWFSSDIFKLPSIRKMREYNKSIHLDYDEEEEV